MSYFFRLVTFQILETSSSLKVCNRVGAVLRRLVLGVLVNEGMTSRDILLLCHGLVSESLPLLTKRDRYTHTHTHKSLHQRQWITWMLISMYDSVYVCVL